jgi:hypothetical protein
MAPTSPRSREHPHCNTTDERITDRTTDEQVADRLDDTRRTRCRAG